MITTAIALGMAFRSAPFGMIPARPKSHPQVEAILRPIVDSGNHKVDKQKAEAALILARSLKDKVGEVNAQFWIVRKTDYLREFQTAQKGYAELVPKFKAIGDGYGVSLCIHNRAACFSRIGDLDTAERLYLEALKLRIASGDRIRSALTQNNLAEVRWRKGDIVGTFDYFEQARRTRPPKVIDAAEAAMISNLGLVYASLGAYDMANQYLLASLSCRRIKVREPSDYAMTFRNLAMIAAIKGDRPAVKEHILESYKILNLMKTPDNLALSRILIFESSISLQHGLLETATEQASRALALAPIVAASEIAQAHLMLAKCKAKLGDASGATQHVLNALALQPERLSPLFASEAIRVLAGLYQETSPQVAIGFLYDAVRIKQQIRKSVKSAAQGLEQGFIDREQDAYRDLIRLLIDQNRLGEAQTVIALLKAEELNGATTRSADGVLQFEKRVMENAPSGGASWADYKAKSAEIMLRYNKLLLERATAGNSWTPEKDAQLKDAETAKLGIDSMFRTIFNEISKTFNGAEQTTIAAGLANIESLPARLSELSHGSGLVAAVSTVVHRDRTDVIIASPDGLTTLHLPLDRDQTIRLATSLRIAIDRPTIDPKPAAKALYEQFLKPIDEALDKINAKHVLMCFDGPMRMVPVGVLHDGTRYVIEREDRTYSMYSPLRLDTIVATSTNLKEVAAFGASKGGSNLSPLPGVATELDQVAKLTNATPILDKDFTAERFTNEVLARRPTYIHLATHFRLETTYENSEILLGNGTTYTLKQMGGNASRFSGVQCLVLSACNTAVENATNMEGLAWTTMKLGAMSVMASLWPVADHSTPFLMSRFYTHLVAGVPRAEALRKAQVDMLRAGPAELKAFNELTLRSTSSGQGTKFKVDPDHPLAHPFFWAPFQLYGGFR